MRYHLGQVANYDSRGAPTGWNYDRARTELRQNSRVAIHSSRRQSLVIPVDQFMRCH